MSRDVSLLHPLLQRKVLEFTNICKARGLNVLITETFRTQAEQDALYAKGRTDKSSAIVTYAMYPNSGHNWGVAFDFCRNEKGREYDNSDGFFEKCGAVARAVGLAWGGDFISHKDRPHCQYPAFMPNGKTDALEAKYGTPDKFIATWNQTGEEEDPTAAPKLPVRVLKYQTPMMHGEDVRLVQTKLEAAGFDVGAVDGYYGTKTVAAVKLFQADRGLTVDGKVGARTREALGIKL
jgi:Putative peptidoglycan binding domain/D-alanyl-D-alanine carboxypeptidase